MDNLSIISFLIFIPLLSAIYIAIFTKANEKISEKTGEKGKAVSEGGNHLQIIAFASTALNFLLSIYLLYAFDSKLQGYQFTERLMSIESIGFEYYVGIDGISIYFVLLTTFLSLILIPNILSIESSKKSYLICFLLIESLCIGAFCALNLLLFFIFFEIILIPMYLIIGIWGGENRIYAAVKFFIYTFFGSVFFFISILYLFSQLGSLDFAELYDSAPTLSFEEQKWLWFALFFAFAVKLPMPPFHTWLPDAHVQAPTAGSVILAGVLLKLGGYAMMRILVPMLPAPSLEYAIYVLYISGFAIIYASLTSLAQKDMKKMIAYSSVAHMGYVSAGLFSFNEYGASGAMFQMISHGIISSALFLAVGVLYQRHHTKEISAYGGVAHTMPKFAFIFLIAVMGSVGLPGTSGFIGEFLSIIGSYKANMLVGILAASGVVFGAIYMLKLYKDVMLGSANAEHTLKFPDLTFSEKFALVPLAILIVYLGVFPSHILSVINMPIEKILIVYK